jgi:hypothetical protein
MHTDGVNQALASTFGIDLVISKSDNILTLREHLIALLVSGNSPTSEPEIPEVRQGSREAVSLPAFGFSYLPARFFASLSRADFFSSSGAPGQLLAKCRASITGL